MTGPFLYMYSHSSSLQFHVVILAQNINIHYSFSFNIHITLQLQVIYTVHNTMSRELIEVIDLTTAEFQDNDPPSKQSYHPSLKHQGHATGTYRLTPNEILSLAMEGLEYNSIPFTVQHRSQYLSMLHEAKERAVVFKNINDQRSPVSGIDFHILNSFGYQPQYQDQVVKMWRVIQHKYNLHFHINYLVRCTAYRLSIHEMRPQWKTIILSTSPPLTTRLQLTQYCLRYAIFQFEKDGMFLPIQVQCKQIKGINDTLLSYITNNPDFFPLISSNGLNNACFSNISYAQDYLHQKFLNILRPGNKPFYIYCVALAPTAGSGQHRQVIYVGQTRDLYQRVMTHSRYKQAPKKLRELWKAHACGDTMDRKSWNKIFTLFLLDVVDNTYDADDKEMYFIDYFNTAKDGANDLPSAPGQSAKYWLWHKANQIRQQKHQRTSATT
jgi:hypothetical protein